MFRWGKTLIALALMMAMPVAVSAQTADKPPAPQAQAASQTPPNAELLKPEQLEALIASPTCWRRRPIRWRWCRPTAG